MPLSNRFRGLAVAVAAALAFLGHSAVAEAKTFRINVVGDPAQMDPVTVSEITAGRILKNMYEGFTDVDPDGKVIKVLAESWEPIADGNGFRFHLRKGVKFHSGRPFTAKDVKYTLEMLANPDSKGGLAAPYLANIVGAADVAAGKTKELSGVKIVDDNTVDITFTKPEVLFPIYPIFYMDSGIVAEQGPDWMTKVSAGTGPYKFKSWTRGVSVDLVANLDYWGGAPKIDGVSFLIVPSGDTALAQYDAGELDFVDVYEPSFRRVLKDARYKDQLIEIPRAQVRYLGMNQNLYAPFKDKRVREALSLSLDRAGIIKGIYGGAAFPAKGFITPGVPGYTPNLPDLKYDPEAAKKLMAEAGYPDGKGLPPVDIQTTEPFKAEVSYYADQFNRVLGMPVSVKIAERATFIKSMNAGQVPFFSWAWTIDYPDAMSYLGDMWFGSSPYNRPKWKNADYDRLIERARTTADEAKRFALYSQAEKILLDDWGAVPLPTTAVLALRKPNVHNVTITPFGFSTFKDITID
jgi:oligopeptide transport system substrate-binding protein